MHLLNIYFMFGITVNCNFKISNSDNLWQIYGNIIDFYVLI